MSRAMAMRCSAGGGWSWASSAWRGWQSGGEPARIAQSQPELCSCPKPSHTILWTYGWQGECMSEVLDALVIGAGPAGLGVSYFLKRQGRDHRVLDRGRIGETWRTQRWNSFRLNSPTIRSILPGDPTRGRSPGAR
ncbi:NAD(P)-binding protein [Mesorhizobium sp. M1163]|uniref:NAD(P)-binding protein n=1 Tax=Mesorhizobium sp. M1163 TaxID=2957065 RepID=UPI003335D686